MEGKLSIGKVTCCGNSKEDYISIEIEDTLSSIQFVRVRADLETFTKALFGLGCVPIEFELNGIERVGKKYEYKTVEVSIPHVPSRFEFTDEEINKAIDKAVSKYEVSGWVGSREDCKNYHNQVHYDKTHQEYNVHFCRWVEVEEGNEKAFQKATCNWSNRHPGSRQFICDHCGIYTASKARCTKCQEEG